MLHVAHAFARRWDETTGGMCVPKKLRPDQKTTMQEWIDNPCTSPFLRKYPSNSLYPGLLPPPAPPPLRRPCHEGLRGPLCTRDGGGGIASSCCAYDAGCGDGLGDKCPAAFLSGVTAVASVDCEHLYWDPQGGEWWVQRADNAHLGGSSALISAP